MLESGSVVCYDAMPGIIQCQGLCLPRLCSKALVNLGESKKNSQKLAEPKQTQVRKGEAEAQPPGQQTCGSKRGLSVGQLVSVFFWSQPPPTFPSLCEMLVETANSETLTSNLQLQKDDTLSREEEESSLLRCRSRKESCLCELGWGWTRKTSIF